MESRHGTVPLVAAGFVISFVAVGGGINTAGIFLSGIALDTGWLRSSLSLAVSVGAVVAALSMPAVGAAVDRFGVRVPMAAGTLLLAGGYALCASMLAPWQFVAANVLLGAGFGATALLPMTLAISLLVPERKALALGIAAAGSSAGALVMAPAVQLAIERFGWRGAYVGMGVLVFAIPLALVLLVLPRGRLPRSQDVPRSQDAGGAAGSGEPGVRAESVAPADEAAPGVALAGRAWLPLVGVMVLPGLVTFGLAVHLVPHLVASGLAQRAAAVTLGAALGLSALGKVAGGWLADRIGLLPTLRGALACGALAVTLLVLPPTTAVLSGFALLYGLYLGTTVAVIPPIALEVLGAARFGSLFGVLQLVGMLAGAIGPVATGAVFDVTGSYRNAILAWIVALGAALVVAFALRAGVRAAPRAPVREATPTVAPDPEAAPRPTSS